MITAKYTMKYTPILFATLFAINCLAETYGFRHDGSGKFPEANPPTVWSTDKNVVWKTPMPAPGNSSPILVGDQIFVCAETDTLVCVNATDGKILWQKACNGYRDVLTPAQAAQAKIDQAKSDELWPKVDLGGREVNNLNVKIQAAQKGIQSVEAQLKEKPGDPGLKQNLDAKTKQLAPLKQTCDEKNAFIKKTTAEIEASWAIPVNDGTAHGYAQTTPISDGKNVYACFGTGVTVCYDLAGNRKWIRFLAKPYAHGGQRQSPLLFDDKLLVCSGKMFLLNASEGKDIWKNDFWVGPGTPVLTRIDGEAMIVGNEGCVMRASDGKLLIRGCYRDWQSPVVQDAVIYLTTREGSWALKLPAHVPQTQIPPEKIWEHKPMPKSYYTPPIVENGLVYALAEKRVLTVMDAKTGATVYDRELPFPGKGWSSGAMTLAGKYIFASNADGTTLVFEAGREYKQVACNELKLEDFRSTLVFRGKRMYVRTPKDLYCVGE